MGNFRIFLFDFPAKTAAVHRVCIFSKSPLRFAGALSKIKSEKAPFPAAYAAVYIETDLER